MILVNRVLGHCQDAFWESICDDLEGRGLMELLPLEARRLGPGRFRARTDKGTTVGLRLDEEAVLRPGAVLFYEAGRRIVLAQLKDARVLVIATLNEFSSEDALILGHYLGSLGWPMRLRRHATHVEIFVDCGEDEALVEEAMRLCPLPNIAWTLRERAASDPLFAPVAKPNAALG